MLALAAVLEGREEYEIVDGNLDDNPVDTILSLIDSHKVDLLGVSCMPGPQMVAAMETSREIRRLRPHIKIVWGGYFPAIYPDSTLNAKYVDFVVRGQGEDTLLELIDAVRGKRSFDSILGLSYKDAFGLHRNNAERPMKGPDSFPWSPFHRLPVEKYLRPSFFGKRTAVHHASIGCPFNCSFCGVHAAYGREERMESPERTVAILKHLIAEYGADSVQFYDMNFFLREDHARDLCDRMAPLKLRWWCEARVDALARFSDATWRALRDAGLSMVFCGAESGSDEVLARMNKGTTTEQILTTAAKTRQHGIIPEFSFIFGDPEAPAQELENTLAFVRKLKAINPAMELISYFYTPTPQRRQTYGGVDARAGTPETLEEWIQPEWVAWMTHENPRLPWFAQKLRTRAQDFELVLKSRFPSVHDRQTRGWGKVLGRAASWWRWERQNYDDPRLLRQVRKLARIVPDDSQAYGHLRPAAASAPRWATQVRKQFFFEKKNQKTLFS